MKFSRSKYLKVAAATALALAGLGATSMAQARGNVFFSVGLPIAPGVSIGVSNAPAYYPPQPVYYSQPTYVQPEPAYAYPSNYYVQPAPVYVQPAPVYIGGYYYGGGGGYRHYGGHHGHR
jgi:hypothetical protein